MCNVNITVFKTLMISNIYLTVYSIYTNVNLKKL